MPDLFTKRPVTIEAMKFEGSAGEMHAVYLWVQENTEGSYEYLSSEKPLTGCSIDPSDGTFIIMSLEGEMRVSLGDYVIRGIKGEFYPCKPDIFDASYIRAGQNDDLSSLMN